MDANYINANLKIELDTLFCNPEFELYCLMAGIDIISQKKLILEAKNPLSKILQFQKKLNYTFQSGAVREQDYLYSLQRLILDPKILETFDKLGIPVHEQNIILTKQGLIQKIPAPNIRSGETKIAVDYVIDSGSVFTSFQNELSKLGIIFCSMSEAVVNHSHLLQKYLGSVVPFSDNVFATLNTAVFSDGSFCYIPENTKCPMELSTYFRINTSGTGQFERTLIIADKNSSVSYLEGCTAPQFSQTQIHSAVVELIALEGSVIKYSTVQNWYEGDKEGIGGVYNFVTKRGICLGDNSSISWTQVETGSSITWKYPSVILKGDNTTGEFYSVAVSGNRQQADTGTKMIHIGKNSKSKIISKSISKNQGSSTFRSKVQITKNASESRNYTKCDSLFVEEMELITPFEIDEILSRL